jgi:single-stranded-DNA-specific exonuclease
LLEIAGKRLAGLELHPTLTIDADLPLSQLDAKAFQIVDMFAPFGQENRVPVFLGRGVSVLDFRAAGQNQDHLRFKLRQGNVVWDGIGFNLGDRLKEVTPRIDVVYNLKVDHWGGQDLLQLNVLDFAAAN